MTIRAILAPLAFAVPLVVTAAGPSARATLRDAAGKTVGTATFTQAKNGVKIVVEVDGLPPGKHGFHVHGIGKCEPPDFKTAGGHFNPFGKKHGLANPEGPHAGDLPNLDVDESGKAKATFIDERVTMGVGKASLFGKDGTALVVHAGPDDEKSDPAGSSGARIACGVIER